VARGGGSRGMAQAKLRSNILLRAGILCLDHGRASLQYCV
jgi:hypothetical protein